MSGRQGDKLEGTTGCEWQSGDRHIVFGGGDPLAGAPESWDQAHQWADKANENAGLIRWSWDCHFKIDYDGDVIRISSRFYPPAKYYGPRWDGDCAVMIGDEQIAIQHFECESLDALREQVEGHTKNTVARIISAVRAELRA